MVRELLRESAMGGVVLGDDDEAARILVEAMDDARPPDAPDSREAVAAMGDEGVDEGAAGMPRGGVDDEARRLVDDDEVVILVGDG